MTLTLRSRSPKFDTICALWGYIIPQSSVTVASKLFELLSFERTNERTDRRTKNSTTPKMGMVKMICFSSLDVKDVKG